MNGQERDSVRQEAAASTHVSDQIQDNLETDAEKRNDLLERSVKLNIDESEFFAPGDNVNDEESARAQEKTKEPVKTMTQLRKLRSTDPAEMKESANLQRIVARNSHFQTPAKSIKQPWKSCRQI